MTHRRPVLPSRGILSMVSQEFGARIAMRVSTGGADSHRIHRTLGFLLFDQFFHCDRLFKLLDLLPDNCASKLFSCFTCFLSANVSLYDIPVKRNMAGSQRQYGFLPCLKKPFFPISIIVWHLNPTFANSNSIVPINFHALTILSL